MAHVGWRPCTGPVAAITACCRLHVIVRLASRLSSIVATGAITGQYTGVVHLGLVPAGCAMATRATRRRGDVIIGLETRRGTATLLVALFAIARCALKDPLDMTRLATQLLVLSGQNKPGRAVVEPFALSLVTRRLRNLRDIEQKHQKQDGCECMQPPA